MCFEIKNWYGLLTSKIPENIDILTCKEMFLVRNSLKTVLDSFILFKVISKNHKLIF
jgi:hypothetical protein